MTEFSFTITEEQVEAVLRAVVEEKVDEELRSEYCDSVYTMVRKAVDERVEREIDGECRRYMDELASRTVKEFVAQPVTLDDGWGRRKYGTYEEFLREKMRDEFNGMYNLKREFEDALKDKVEAVWKEIGQKVAAQVIAESGIMGDADEA